MSSPAQPDRFEREVLLTHVLGRNRGFLRAFPDHRLTPAELGRYRCWLSRRARGEPIAYIVGSREFWSLPLSITADVLVPRPETELLVERALPLLRPGAVVLDLGTGSGAVALALAHERSDCRVVASDISAAALAVAQRNARALDLPLQLLQSHWLDALGARFDLITSNPPYIAAGDPHLNDPALQHEPRRALVSGVDGLDALRTIIANAPANLVPGGWLLLEHGHDHAAAVRTLLAGVGFCQIASARDLAGLERVTLGRTADGSTPFD